MNLLPLLFLVASLAPAAEPEVGFQADRRVKAATRFDWEFAAGSGARLPASYDSRKQRYQLHVPDTYKAKRLWPLVLVVPAGDEPQGWSDWQKTCEGSDVLFASPFGGGGKVSASQRIRLVLDVLDDVRQNYRIDPDRTYIVGLGSGAAVAATIAFALPEFFGGVVLDAPAPVPAQDHLRHRVKERLSIAMMPERKDAAPKRLEKYFSPLCRDLKFRSRLWTEAKPAQVYQWLEDDLKRRQSDTKDWGVLGGTAGDPATRVQLSRAALLRAGKSLVLDSGTYEGVRLLEWVLARCGKTASAEKAEAQLKEIRDSDARSKKLLEQRGTDRRALLLACARAHERAGELADARTYWRTLGKIYPGSAEGKKADDEIKRLTALVNTKPYWGLTFAGGTIIVKNVTPGSPAARAGMRPGDRLLEVDGVKVLTLTAARKQLQGHKVGTKVELGLKRNNKELTVTVTVGSMRDKE